VASDKKFYEQLNTLKVEDAPADTIQLLSNPVHLEENNKSVLDAIIQVNKATMRDGKHIPATSAIKTGTATESGTRTTIDFGGTDGAPKKGEVWRIISMTIESVSGGSGSVTYDIYLLNGSEIQAIAKRSVTSPPVIINDEVEYPAGLEIDENTILQFTATRSSLTSSKIQVYAYRLY